MNNNEIKVIKKTYILGFIAVGIIYTIVRLVF